MIVLDENFPESQRLLLRSWRISVRQVGLDVGRFGMKDDEIIPLLISLPKPTFCTLDRDFYMRDLCNNRYCLVMVAVPDDIAAAYVRRPLKHAQFGTSAKRLGAALRISSAGIRCWRSRNRQEVHYAWI